MDGADLGAASRSLLFEWSLPPKYYSNETCFNICDDWATYGKEAGSYTEEWVMRGLQFFTAVVSFVILVFYAYEAWKATVGWEEVYVCSVERECGVAGGSPPIVRPPSALTDSASPRRRRSRQDHD